MPNPCFSDTFAKRPQDNPNKTLRTWQITDTTQDNTQLP